RNGRRKFRSPVHSPSWVLLWTSRTPSPSSSRAHSPAPWQTEDRGCPVSASRSYPRQSSVCTRPGGSLASRTTRLSVPESACRSTDIRSRPLSRPTTPQTGGRSLSQLPWPRALFAVFVLRTALSVIRPDAPPRRPPRPDVRRTRPAEADLDPNRAYHRLQG